MTTVPELIAYLQDALRRPERLVADVQRFQHAVWEAPDRDTQRDSAVAWAELEALAYELNHFVPDQTIRREDPAYYGSERAVEVIRAGLDRLHRSGAARQNEAAHRAEQRR